MSEKIELSGDTFAQFGASFLGEYLKAGFAVLPKGHLDLLVFKALQDAGTFDGMDNYRIASILGITERRVRNFRLNAALRFERVDRDAALAAVFRSLFEFGTTKAVTKDGVVAFELDDPVLQREFEQAARDLGYYTETSFRGTLIKVELHTLLAVFENLFPSAQKQILGALKAEAQKLGVSADELQKQGGIADQVKWLLAKHGNKVQAGASVLTKVLQLMPDTA